MTHLFSGSTEQLGFDPLILQDKGQFSDRTIKVNLKLTKKTKNLLCLCDAKESHAMGGWPATVSESVDGKTTKPITHRLAEQHLFSP